MARLCCLQRSSRRKAHGCFSTSLPQPSRDNMSLAIALSGSCKEIVVFCSSLPLLSFLCSTVLCLLAVASIHSSGNSNRQVTKAKRTESACFFSVVSDLSLVRSWTIWNARKMWTQKEMCWRAAGPSPFPWSESTYLYWQYSGLSDIRLTFKLGTDSAITLIAPGTSECSTEQINNDVCSSR